MPDIPEETHGLSTFLFPRLDQLRIPMKNPSRSFFFFLATLGMLMALAGPFMMGYYAGRNGSLAKLGLPLCVGGAALLIYGSVVYKKQKGNPASPR